MGDVPRGPADRPVDVGAGVDGIAARTEQHHVGRRSVEALVDRRRAGGDQLDLGAAEGPVTPDHLPEVPAAVHARHDSHAPRVVLGHERQRTGHVGPGPTVDGPRHEGPLLAQTVWNDAGRFARPGNRQVLAWPAQQVAEHVDGDRLDDQGDRLYVVAVTHPSDRSGGPLPGDAPRIDRQAPDDLTGQWGQAVGADSVREPGDVGGGLPEGKPQRPSGRRHDRHPFGGRPPGTCDCKPLPHGLEGGEDRRIDRSGKRIGAELSHRRTVVAPPPRNRLRSPGTGIAA